MKADERFLMLAVLNGTFPRTAGENLGMPQNRVDYLCNKWTMRGWYEFGVTIDLGWLTRHGIEKAKRL